MSDRLKDELADSLEGSYRLADFALGAIKYAGFVVVRRDDLRVVLDGWLVSDDQRLVIDNEEFSAYDRLRAKLA